MSHSTARFYQLTQDPPLQWNTASGALRPRHRRGKGCVKEAEARTCRRLPGVGRKTSAVLAAAPRATGDILRS